MSGAFPSAAYRKQLARKISDALSAAEKHAHKEGFELYPYLFGYIAGDCGSEANTDFDARIAQLYEQRDKARSC